MKKLTVILALLLSCLVTLSLVGCDLLDSTVDTDDVSGSSDTSVDAETDSFDEEYDETPDTEEPLHDQSLEDQAKANMKTVTNMSSKGTTLTEMSMVIDGETYEVLQGSEINTYICGDNEYAELYMAQNALGSVTQTLTETTRIGNSFYVYTLSQAAQSVENYIIVNATDSEIETAMETLGTKADELMYSINHYQRVNEVKNDDGSVTYTCTGLRLSAATLYQEALCAVTSMMGVPSQMEINREAAKYEVTIKDGKFVSVAVDMTIDMVLDINGQIVPVSCTYDIDQAYTYGDVEPISAPTEAGFSNAVVLTWSQYWELVQQSTKVS